MIRTAILVDGAFFLKRYPTLFHDTDHQHSAQQVANNLHSICSRHLFSKSNKLYKYNPHEASEEGNQYETNYLYRIFYYDCEPLKVKTHHPITRRPIDFEKQPEALFRTDLFKELKKKRKMALRLGNLQNRKSWKISSKKLTGLLSGKVKIEDLQETDIKYNMIQKGVDIKIGVDIVSLALKKQVDRIILISGDGDFVPAAKLARREGIDFILDNLWSNITPSLHEHIDGLR